MKLPPGGPRPPEPCVVFNPKLGTEGDLALHPTGTPAVVKTSPCASIAAASVVALGKNGAQAGGNGAPTVTPPLAGAGSTEKS